MVKADVALLLGAFLAATWLVAFLAIPVMLVGVIYLARAQARGELTRPWTMTLVGLFCLIDAGANADWAYDLFFGSHTDTIRTLYGAWGKLVDGAYYVDYNALPLGGVSNPAEKSYQVWGTVAMYPMRIAACVGFLQMKRWGLQAMIVTSFTYMVFWVGYMANALLDFNARAGAAELGNLGLWVALLFYATPFILLPYFFRLDRELFRDER